MLKHPRRGPATLAFCAPLHRPAPHHRFLPSRANSTMPARPPNGTYDFKFFLYDAAGTQLGPFPSSARTTSPSPTAGAPSNSTSVPSSPASSSSSRSGSAPTQALAATANAGFFDPLGRARNITAAPQCRLLSERRLRRVRREHHPAQRPSPAPSTPNASNLSSGAIPDSRLFGHILGPCSLSPTHPTSSPVSGSGPHRSERRKYLHRIHTLPPASPALIRASTGPGAPSTSGVWQALARRAPCTEVLAMTTYQTGDIIVAANPGLLSTISFSGTNSNSVLKGGAFPHWSYITGNDIPAPVRHHRRLRRQTA